MNGTKSPLFANTTITVVIEEDAVEAMALLAVEMKDVAVKAQDNLLDAALQPLYAQTLPINQRQ